MIERIVTHPGGAHKDDLLAVCVLIAKYGSPVLRRDPTPDDLADPRTAVVDIGGAHEPERHNFDHHHFPREHAPTCALSLVLDHLGLYQDALRFCDWLEPAEWFDSRGPVKTAQWLEVPRKAISQLNSPIDITLLRRFARTTELEAGNPLYEFMRFVGQDLLDYLHDVRARIDRVASECERWALTSGEDTIAAIFLPRSDNPIDEPSGSVASFVRAEGLEQEIAAIVYPDRRGNGYGIQRYEDHPRLDFARVGDAPDVRFAHKTGFMCKTATTDPERLKALIIGAWE